MNTIALINLIMTYPDPGEWLKVRGSKGRESAIHWFRSSRKGGRIIFHKVEDNGPAEGLSQATMSAHYRGFRWDLA